MDVLAVMRAVKFAKEWTTSGKGPLLLEMVTYRYGGHSMSDPGTTYRTREEIQHMRSSNDPITGLKNLMLEWGVVEEAELKKIDKDARAVVEKAVAEAKSSPEPSLETTLWSDVYYRGTNPMWLRGREREEVRSSIAHRRRRRPLTLPACRSTTLPRTTRTCTRTARPSLARRGPTRWTRSRRPSELSPPSLSSSLSSLSLSWVLLFLSVRVLPLPFFTRPSPFPFSCAAT